MNTTVGTEVIWLIIGSGFAIVLALTNAALALQRGSMSPVRLLLGVWLAALVLLGLGQIAVLGAWDLQGHPAEPELLRLGATTHAVVHLVGPLSVGPAGAVTLLVCAFLGARSGPRSAGLPAVAGLLALGVALLVLAGGMAAGNPAYPTLRALGYLGAGGLVAGALCGLRGGDVAAGQAGLAAAALYPLVVAVGEGSGRGLVHLLLVLQAAKVPDPKWGIGLAQMLGHTAPEWAASFVALVLAMGVPAAAVLGCRAAPRLPGALAALLGAVLAAGVLVGSDVSPERLMTLSLIPSSADAHLPKTSSESPPP
jgi:hypothetical protein